MVNQNILYAFVINIEVNPLIFYRRFTIDKNTIYGCTSIVTSSICRARILFGQWKNPFYTRVCNAYYKSISKKEHNKYGLLKQIINLDEKIHTFYELNFFSIIFHCGL